MQLKNALPAKAAVVVNACSLFVAGRVFNGSASHQYVGVDVRNVTFATLLVAGCTSVDVILGTNSSKILVDNYRLSVSATTVIALYVAAFTHDIVV